MTSAPLTLQSPSFCLQHLLWYFYPFIAKLDVRTKRPQGKKEKTGSRGLILLSGFPCLGLLQMKIQAKIAFPFWQDFCFHGWQPGHQWQISTEDSFPTFPSFFSLSLSRNIRVGIPEKQGHAPHQVSCHHQDSSSISMILIITLVFDPRFQLWMLATEKSRPHSQMSNEQSFRKCCWLFKFNIIQTTHQLPPWSILYRRTCDKIHLPLSLPLFCVSYIFTVPKPLSFIKAQLLFSVYPASLAVPLKSSCNCIILLVLKFIVTILLYCFLLTL